MLLLQASLFQPYVCLETECIQQTSLSIDIEKKVITVTTAGKKKTSPLRVWNDHGGPAPVLDVFSLFDAFECLAAEPYMAVVVFVDHCLGEENCDDGGFQEVVGRACGDRIAVVSTKDCVGLQHTFVSRCMSAFILSALIIATRGSAS